MIDVIDGHLVLDAAGLTLFIFTVGGVFGLLSAALTWAGLRSHYRPDPAESSDQGGEAGEGEGGAEDETALRIVIDPPAPGSSRGGHLPMFMPGPARPLPPLAVTAVQPALNDRGCPR